MATLLTQREAASVLRLSERTLERMRVHGSSLRFVRLSRRSIRYRQADLDAYIACIELSDRADDLAYENRGPEEQRW